MQNCVRVCLPYTRRHPSDFLISWVSKPFPGEQCDSPKEITLNYIPFHQHNTVFIPELPSSSQISAAMSRTHMMGLLLTAKLTKAGGLRTVLSVCLFYVPLYRPPPEKKVKKNKEDARSLCFPNCLMS